jgi:hypothetical protein
VNNEMTDFEIARAVHEVHRAIAYAQNSPFANGPFDSLPPDRQEVVINMVRLIRSGATREQVQDAWVDYMYERGFRYGDFKDYLSSPPRHPGMLPWHKLGTWDRRKVEAAYCLVEKLSGL